MKLPEKKSPGVLEKLRKHLRDEIKFSSQTISKHYKNWNKAISFAENNSLSFNIEKAEEVDRFIKNLSLKGKEFIETNPSIPYSMTLLSEYVRYGTIYTTFSTSDLTGPISSEIIQFLSTKKAEHIGLSSYRQYELQLSRFLNFLKQKHIKRVKDISYELLQLYIMGLDPRHRSNVYIAILNIRRFLGWLYENHLIDINVAIKLPKVRMIKQPTLPSVYSKEEITLLLSKVDRGNATGKRDYLVLILAAYLGMRSSDICSLKFDNIDWDNNQINFIQKKTDQPQTLPLFPEIGNAIIDYLKNGRPESTEPHILLNASAPFSPMGTPMVHNITTKAFKRAGIDTSNRKHGAHSLRHSLASRMLENQTSVPVISETLGHIDSNSTMYYMRVDITSLRSCQLESSSVEESFYQQFN